jgi:hypothetical protein
MAKPHLELIPDDLLRVEQEKCRPYRYEVCLPVYKLTWEPMSLEEFDWEARNDMVIWRDNGTVMLICNHGNHQHYG